MHTLIVRFVHSFRWSSRNWHRLGTRIGCRLVVTAVSGHGGDLHVGHIHSRHIGWILLSDAVIQCWYAAHTGAGRPQAVHLVSIARIARGHAHDGRGQGAHFLDVVEHVDRQVDLVVLVDLRTTNCAELYR